MSFYNPNIPQSTDFLSQSQQDIQNNFQQADTSFDINHYAFSNVTANNGKHSYIEMVNEAILPVGLTDEEGTLYTKKVSGESQMFYSPDDTGREYQMTNVIESEFATFGTNTNYAPNLFGGWTYLPGGLILQYGLSTTILPILPITFPITFPNNIFSLNTTNSASSPVTMSLSVGTITTSSFTVIPASSVLGGLYWTAIGN